MADRNPMCREEHCEEPMDRCLDCPRRKRPTDPAPRGADAVDFEQASRVAHTLALGADGLPPRDLLTLARAYLALRSPVPAEATSGAELSGRAWSIIRDAMMRACRAEREEQTTERFSAMIDAFAAKCEQDLAALRTPPAPLPREGATVAEVRPEMVRAALEASAVYRNGTFYQYDDAVAAAHLTAALTPAAQPTTKETR